jgi:hypothetical protein
MKRILLLATCCFFGAQSSLFAQETAKDTLQNNVEKGHLYIGMGGSFNTDYNINEKLAAFGAPEIGNGGFNLTLGYNYFKGKMLMDAEWNTIYNSEQQKDGLRVRTLGTGFKLRTHWVPFDTGKTFFSVGGDVSFMFTQFDLFSAHNRVNLDDLYGNSYPNSVQNYHVSLYNQQLFVGPSVSAGFFQKSDFPLRLNVGYEWGVTNGKWKSEFAEVDNTVKESGIGRFNASVIVYLF